jgi:hypothetical protein
VPVLAVRHDVDLLSTGILNDDEAVDEGRLDLLTCTEEGVIFSGEATEDEGKNVESDTELQEGTGRLGEGRGEGLREVERRRSIFLNQSLFQDNEKRRT